MVAHQKEGVWHHPRDGQQQIDHVFAGVAAVDVIAKKDKPRFARGICFGVVEQYFFEKKRKQICAAVDIADGVNALAVRGGGSP